MEGGRRAARTGDAADARDAAIDDAQERDDARQREIEDALDELQEYLRANAPAAVDDGALADIGSEGGLGADERARLLAAVARLADETRTPLDPGAVLRAFVTAHGNLARAMATHAVSRRVLARALVHGDRVILKALGALGRRLAAVERAGRPGPGAGWPPADRAGSDAPARSIIF